MQEGAVCCYTIAPPSGYHEVVTCAVTLRLIINLSPVFIPLPQYSGCLVCNCFKKHKECPVGCFTFQCKKQNEITLVDAGMEQVTARNLQLWVVIGTEN